MSDSNELLQEIRSLNKHVQDLSNNVNVSFTSVRRLRRMTNFALFLAGLLVVFSVSIYDLYGDVQDAQESSCSNRNEQARASKELWNYILDVSESSRGGLQRSPDFYDAMHVYVNELYGPRDCNDLTRKYPQPNAPRTPEPHNDAG